MSSRSLRNLTLIVLDHGELALEDSQASDLSVVNAARVSFGRKDAELDEAGRGLIKYLMRNRHGTPFEHNSFTWRIKCPIFVAREWQRHRIGSFNEQSQRYSVIEPEFYLPTPRMYRTQVGKPGAYTYEPAEESVGETAWEYTRTAYGYALEAYEEMLHRGIAREQARLVLPMAVYTQFIWTVNARSLMNFLSLRNSDQAQYEIRQYAIALEAVFAEEMPITYEAFVDGGRVAP